MRTLTASRGGIRGDLPGPCLSSLAARLGAAIVVTPSPNFAVDNTNSSVAILSLLHVRACRPGTNGTLGDFTYTRLASAAARLGTCTPRPEIGGDAVLRARRVAARAFLHRRRALRSGERRSRGGHARHDANATRSRAIAPVRHHRHSAMDRAHEVVADASFEQ